MEQGARDWLEGERAKGVKRLDIKVKGRNHYVYESTTHREAIYALSGVKVHKE